MEGQIDGSADATDTNGATGDEDGLIAGYLSRVYPVYWVRWWTHLPECPDKDRLAQVLLGEAGELRDLESPEIRPQVLSCILEGVELREMVMKEIDEFLDSAVDMLYAEGYLEEATGRDGE